MKYWWILFVVLEMGCASVQRVVECTMEERQVIADPLADAIQDDVRAGRHAPSRFLSDQIQGFITEYGIQAVRCGLRELLAEWRRDDTRTLNNQLSIQITEDLLDQI